MLSEIIGMTLNEAKTLLTNKVIIDTIKVTSPPRERSEEFDDSYRILKADYIKDNRIALVVCRPL